MFYFSRMFKSCSFTICISIKNLSTWYTFDVLSKMTPSVLLDNLLDCQLRDLFIVVYTTSLRLSESLIDLHLKVTDIFHFDYVTV